MAEGVKQATIRSEVTYNDVVRTFPNNNFLCNTIKCFTYEKSKYPIICDAGGVSVLAHPYNNEKEKYMAHSCINEVLNSGIMEIIR